ncbi:Peptidase C48 SUMO/Sentrin/Ubl1 [Penicillium riverlandense]|uniref:Peptidase C48 SUMO/Sentrin/Ubl1 n=1 Tax=Penicillium riverlandense TaxID=1903569 RepID=UPI0025471927|nr:Peptidase C48 SUMO/Sentrin/Ubl1 [Penicillium riverlandense]KAJ5832004.1 Peptidase C48 SUMO/Sentrin/Ubl1 [Penicillium riverlandense]
MNSQRDPATRQKLTQGPSPSLGTSAQMWKRDQPRNDAQDEARLMGAKSYRDPGATTIKPGASFLKNRKPGASGAFRPADTLSKHSKASGPVRAQGKERQSNSRRPYLENAWEFDESDRPNKRRRHDQSSPTINLTDDVTEPVSSIMEMLPPANQLSPRLPSGRQKNKSHERQQLPEYRDLEDIVKVNRVDRSPHSQGNRRFSSASSLDEGQFTENAAQQRRSMAANAHAKSDRSQRQTVFPSVEIRNPTNLGSPTSRRRQVIKSEGMRRISDFTRESSDELQGGATTHPVPKSLDSSPNLARWKTESKTQLRSPVRERSPTDIKTTNFAASPRQGPKMKNKKKKRDLWLLEINSIRFGPIKKATTEGERMTIHLDVEKETIELGEDIVGTGKTVSIPLRQIRKVLQGREISCKVRIELSLAANSPGDKVDVEFTNSADKLRLCNTLQSFQVNMQDKDRSFMDKIFATYERNMELHSSHTKKPLLKDVVVLAEPEMPSAKPSTRTKVSSALQDVNGEISRGKPDHDKEGGGGQEPLKFKSRHSSDEQTRPQSSKADGDAGVEIPVKKFQAAQSSGRETRASARLTPKTSAASEECNANTRRSPSTDDEARKKWQNPLVYPKAGKKKAEVCVEDRDRLREGEFLNDNLIGFYIRFLQDHLERTNKRAAEKIYFFNSYFHATITNTPRGAREINYSGVEKWTRSVDLFAYDYIVVPINENAHWYVAIICNLPSLSLPPGGTVESDHTGADAKETSTRPTSEVQTIPETPEPEPVPDLSEAAAGAAPEKVAESSKEQETRQSLASMTLDGANAATKKEKQEDGGPTDEWPEEEENVKSPPAKFGPVRDKTENPETPVESATAPQPFRKSKKTRTGPKLDPRQPTIITFDSLDLARSPTVKVLRDYICKEAASKKGVELDAAKIKGMRARQVPLQPNYSDCGLYLLAYIEKFVQDPDPFITKILRRDMDAKADWPPLGSGLLRHRLRKFLDDLYEEQTRDKVDSQAIMANQQPVSFLLGPPLPSEPDKDVADSTETLDTAVAAESSVKDDGANEDAPDVESSAPDQVELVPTGPSDGVAPRPESTGEPSREKAMDLETENDREVIEVPDSQETAQTKLGHKKKKFGRQGKDKDLGDPSIRKRKKGTDKLGVRAEVQIRGTPPPTEESGRVRRSPRGMSQRDCS